MQKVQFLVLIINKSALYTFNRQNERNAQFSLNFYNVLEQERHFKLYFKTL
jgi:hypothetical protein